jgi:hypothetical protein
MQCGLHRLLPGFFVEPRRFDISRRENRDVDVRDGTGCDHGRAVVD